MQILEFCLPKCLLLEGAEVVYEVCEVCELHRATNLLLLEMNIFVRVYIKPCKVYTKFIRSSYIRSIILLKVKFCRVFVLLVN